MLLKCRTLERFCQTISHYLISTRVFNLDSVVPFKILNVIVGDINVLKSVVDMRVIDKGERRLIITL
jgi:hypothetical protein